MYPTHPKARPRQEIGGCKEGEFKIQNSKFKIQNSKFNRRCGASAENKFTWAMPSREEETPPLWWGKIQNSIESTSLTKVAPTRSFSDQSPTPEEGDLGGGSDLNNGECHRLR